MKKVLLIQLKQIGDVLLSTPIINSIKKTYPDYKIDYLVYDYTSGVVENNPNINKIIKITKEERESKFKFFKLLMKIRKEKYDIVIDSLAKVESVLFTVFSGAKLKIGFNKRVRKLFYNRVINVEKEVEVSGEGNTIDLRLSLLKGLDAEIKYDRKIKIFINDEEKKEMKKRMENSGINFDLPVIALGITSRRDYRIWSLDYFIKIINYLIDKYNAQIILFFGPDEEEYIKKAENLINKPKNIFTNIKTKNVRDLLCLLRKSDLYIGNDNGPRHFSQGVETPAFCIFSPTANKWDYNPHNNPKYVAIDMQDALAISYEEHEDLRKKITLENTDDYFKQITPEFVIKKLEDMIDNIKLKETWNRGSDK